MNENDLISQIARFVEDRWAAESKPVLISNIPRLLAGTAFRSVIGDDGVKAFVARTCTEGRYEIVEDPAHKARIGLIPAGAAYTFPALTPRAASTDGKGGGIVLSFLKLLGELTEEDQRSVVIPVDVLVKLLQK